MNNPDSLLLAKTLHSTRQLTGFYLKHAEGLDVQKRFTIGNFETNSIHWIVAHLAWGENFLILKGVGNQPMEVKWLEHFKIGSPYPAESAFPDFKETVQTFNQVHDLAVEIVKNLSAEGLQQPNHTKLEFGGGNSNEALLRHAIRHEGMHAGLLSWLLRMHGVKKII